MYKTLLLKLFILLNTSYSIYLKEESSVLAEKASKILEFESMIVFLKEQRELLSNFDKSITKIKEADKVICDEIKIWEAKISQLSLDN
jgi:hypothetical protein